MKIPAGRYWRNALIADTIVQNMDFTILIPLLFPIESEFEDLRHGSLIHVDTEVLFELTAMQP